MSIADGEVAAAALVLHAIAGAHGATGRNVGLRATTITSAGPLARRTTVTSEANASVVTARDTAEAAAANAGSRKSRCIILRLCNVTFIANKANHH